MEITDSRTVIEFQKNTFCGHIRSDVIKVIMKNIQLGHADYSCYWALELLCSGLVHTLWMTLFLGAATYVNRAQPNIFLYLAETYEKYAPIEGKYSSMEMTKIRNNPDVRRIICEAAATIALCRKNKLHTLPTIKPSHDFDSVTIQETIKAPSDIFCKFVLRRVDPISIAIPMNEFCYCLRPDVRDVTKSLYWMSWVFAYCREYKKQSKQTLLFADRSDAFVTTDHARHPVWIYWDAIKKQALPTTKPYIETLYKIYCLRWSPSDAKSRQPILTAAVLLVCEGQSLDTSPVSNNSLAVANILGGIPGWIDAIAKTRQSFS